MARRYRTRQPGLFPQLGYHYAVQGAFGIAVAVLSLLAGLWPTVRRYVGVSVALAAGSVGLVSFDAHPHPGSIKPVWSLLCRPRRITTGTAAILSIGNPAVEDALTGE